MVDITDDVQAAETAWLLDCSLALPKGTRIIGIEDDSIREVESTSLCCQKIINIETGTWRYRSGCTLRDYYSLLYLPEGQEDVTQWRHYNCNGCIDLCYAS